MYRKVWQPGEFHDTSARAGEQGVLAFVMHQVAGRELTEMICD